MPANFTKFPSRNTFAHSSPIQRAWKKGYSVCELATSWVRGDDIPPSVRAVLETSGAYEGATLIEGFFERQVDLRTPGRPSQTDLMVLAWLPSGLGVIAVEGKVEETFGPLGACPSSH